MKKKSSRRSRERFPGLVRELNLRTKWEYLDQDYIDKLSDEEKRFLSDFNEEFYGGSFGHKCNLHRTKKLRRECYARNNSRNRDLYAISRAANQLDEMRPPLFHMDEGSTLLKSQEHCPHNHEDMILELLDRKRS